MLRRHILKLAVHKSKNRQIGSYIKIIFITQVQYWKDKVASVHVILTTHIHSYIVIYELANSLKLIINFVLDNICTCT